MSVRGIGIDIVAVARVDALLRRHGDRFLERCFRPGEVPAPGAGLPPASLAARVAGRWAVKEAVLKALGGDLGAVPYRDIEVGRTPEGAPAVTLHGRAAAALAARGGGRVLASLSHERDHAVGLAVIAE